MRAPASRGHLDAAAVIAMLAGGFEVATVLNGTLPDRVEALVWLGCIIALCGVIISQGRSLRRQPASLERWNADLLKISASLDARDEEITRREEAVALQQRMLP